MTVFYSIFTRFNGFLTAKEFLNIFYQKSPNPTKMVISVFKFVGLDLFAIWI